MDYCIRDVRPQDLEQLEQLEKSCFSCPWSRDVLTSQLPGEHNEFLVAADRQGRLLGYIGMIIVLDEGDISNVAVRPEARRQGIANALLISMLQLAAQRKLSFVTLEVRQSNMPARALYAKHGFLPVGLRKGYYTAPREDAVLMTKFFTEGAGNEDPCL